MQPWNTYAFFEAANVADVVRCLQSGADPNSRNERGFTPLHHVAVAGSLEIATLLLKAGANPNARDEHDDTPLHRAASVGNPKVATALLQSGAEPNVRDKDGSTPMLTALMMRWLHETSARTRELVAVLLQFGADPNAPRTQDGFTPLHSASAGSPELVTMLSEAGASMEARFKNGQTPLHYAASTAFSATVADAVVTALLKAGADPNSRDHDGQLPCDYAKDNTQLKGSDAYLRLNAARSP